MDSGVLMSTVSLAVEIELLKYINVPKDKWPKPDDLVNCPKCKGTGKTNRKGDNGTCYDCLGQARIYRNEAIAQTIASHGDDLQYGGAYCQIAFKAVVDAYVLLRLWTEGAPNWVLGEERRSTVAVKYWSIDAHRQSTIPLKWIEKALLKLK